MPLHLDIPDYQPLEVSLFSGWGHMAEQALFGRALLAAGGLGLAVQVVLLVAVLRRRRALQQVLCEADPDAEFTRPSFRCWPELLSVILLLLPLIIEGISLYARLSVLSDALQGVDPSQRATLLPPGIKERFFGPVLASMMVVIQVLPAAAVIALGTFYRLRLHGALVAAGREDPGGRSAPLSASARAAFGEHPCPGVAFFGALALAAAGALAAFFLSIAGFAARLIETFREVKGVAPASKLKLVLEGIAEAEAPLFSRLWVIAGLTAVAAVAAFVHLHFFSAPARRHRLAPELPLWPRISNRSLALTLALCLGGAALCAILAWPL